MPKPIAIAADQLQAKLDSTQQELSRANVALDVVSAELAQQKRRAKTYMKAALIVGAPVLAIILPLAALYFIPKYLGHFLQARRLGVDLFHKRLKSTVRDAFIIYHMTGYNTGLDGAKRELARNPQGVSPGTVELFQAMDAKTDADWLLAMNAWAKASGNAAIALDDGDQDRFLRIAFAPLPPVDAPHLVTVIMPCYNCAETVTKAVQSILNQSWRNIEIIAVDDASTDDTFAILTGIAQQDNRLRVLQNSVNVGPYVSKNRALNAAKGAYITGHDSDDLALPNRIADQMAPILADAKYKVTIGFAMRVNKFSNFCQPFSGTSIQNYDGVLRLAHITFLVEKQTFKDLFGYWDSVRVSADSEILERALDALPRAICLVTRCMSFMLHHEKSLTQNIQSGLSLLSGHSNVRADYKVSYRAWHRKTNKFKRQIAFPPNPRPFAVPDKINVPLADISRLIQDDHTAQSLGDNRD